MYQYCQNYPLTYGNFLFFFFFFYDIVYIIVCIQIFDNNDISESDNPATSSNPGSNLSREAVVAIISSVTVFVSSSVLFFAIGLSMRLCWSKKSENGTKTDSMAQSNEPAPVYEILNFTTIQQVGHQKQDLELRDNIAYDYVHQQQK